jgi:dipeptidase E
VRRLLLLSNSTSFGAGYLDHAIDAVRSRFAGVRRVAFVPFALKDQEGYAARAAERLSCEGLEVVPVTPDGAGVATVEGADGAFVGGGNTFRLLRLMRDTGVLEVLRRRVGGGMPYMGVSAGTNVAAPTIRTTNDMPIVDSRGLDALALVPFQINPHFVDADPGSRHMGETREDRLREYLEENETPVVGLREGAWLRVDGETVRLEGRNGARIFRRGRPSFEWPTDVDLTLLLEEAT